MIKIYGIREKLDPIKAQLSNTINQCMVDPLSFPETNALTDSSRWQPRTSAARKADRTLIGSPAENWGFSGMAGDEANLDYPIDI